MKQKSAEIIELQNEIVNLKEKLTEAEETLNAIHGGKADAIIVQTETGIKVFTIQGAETAYRIMVDTMSEGALTLDNAGNILYVNTRFCTLLDMPCSVLIGKSIQSLIPPEQVESFDFFLKKTAAGANVHSDFEFIRKDFSHVPVYLSSAPLDTHGREGDICIVVSDLTERRNVHQKLVNLNNQLELKVEERTKELEQQTVVLEKSKNQLQALTSTLEEQVAIRTLQVRNLAKELTISEQRERQRFSQILHEDLQQKLLSAKMHLDMIGHDSINLSRDELFDDISQVKALLQESINTAKAVAVELTPPILKTQGLDAALHWLIGHMEKRYGLAICIDISKDLSVIRGTDQILMIQIVRELIYNVVKHAQTKEIVISGRKWNSKAELKIEDHGVGFELSLLRERQLTQSKMFGIFSIEERLRLFGGSIDIQSILGKGTIVRVLMPINEEGIV